MKTTGGHGKVNVSDHNKADFDNSSKVDVSGHGKADFDNHGKVDVSGHGKADFDNHGKVDISGHGKVDVLTERLAQALRSGEYGAAGSRFITVRELASRHKLSLESACAVMSRLSERRLVRLYGKHYYLTTGFASLDTPLGQLLRKSRKKLLAMLVNSIDNPFFASLAKELGAAAYADGYQLILSSSDGNVTHETEILDEFISLGAAGVFACPGLSSELYNVYSTYPLPLISLGRDLATHDRDCVLVDNYSAGAQVAKHLYSIGCRKFAYIGMKSYIDNDPRMHGYIDEIRRMGGEFLDENIVSVGKIDDRLDLGSISGCLNRLLYNIPQGLKVGIFCYHDLIAVETLRLIKHRPEKTSERRLLIPDDVCVAGFDDLPIASAVTPPLTTISYRYASIAKKSFDIMLDHISNPDHKPGKYEISSSLIIRGSTVRKN